MARMTVIAATTMTMAIAAAAAPAATTTTRVTADSDDDDGGSGDGGNDGSERQLRRRLGRAPSTATWRGRGLRRMKADKIKPMPNTWRGTLKAAKKARRSDIADSIWDAALVYHSRDIAPFEPQASDVALLMSVYVSKFGGTSDHAMRNALNWKIILLYEGITSKSEVRGLHHESLSMDEGPRVIER
jgi:hypothetical protein